MAEFQEVMKQKKRMCNSTLCCKCDIYHACGEDLSSCQQFILNNLQKAEEIIMCWAAEHPELKYPTFFEWVADIISNGWKSIENDHDFVEWMNLTRIPADMAEKLGIEPKER